MANPAVTNVTGSNPGPQSDTLPDTTQSPTGNIWKAGVFTVTLTPAVVGTGGSAEQTFAATGIGLLTTDVVLVQKATSQAGLAIGGSRVSAADTLAINFVNATAVSITPTANQAYLVAVFRPQPNWAAQATGSQLDW
jgi:hypothetical protein